MAALTSDEGIAIPLDKRILAALEYWPSWAAQIVRRRLWSSAEVDSFELLLLALLVL